MLYKLDGGVDHILVDEAQDTNPEQWAIIEALADEFFAGAGARETVAHAVRRRRREAVDLQLPRRQSGRFGTVGRAFKNARPPRASNGMRCRSTCRSAPRCRCSTPWTPLFARPAAAQGLTFIESAVIKHHANRQGEAGLVEFWEVRR